MRMKLQLDISVYIIVSSCPLEASLSLESAASRFLKKHAVASVSSRRKVKLAWSLEIHPPCRDVLQKTYAKDNKHCLFGDILKTDRPDGKAYCANHGKFCPMFPKKKNNDDERTLAIS